MLKVRLLLLYPYFLPFTIFFSSVQQNKILESKIQRSPSRVAVKSKKPESIAAGNLTVSASGPGTSAIFGSNLGNSLFPGSLGPSNYGPQMFLRIRVLDTLDAVHVSTTIPVYVTPSPLKAIRTHGEVFAGPQPCICRRLSSLSAENGSCTIPRSMHCC